MNHASNSEWSRGPFRAKLRCELEFTGPLHVGTGEALSLATDAPVLRDAGGRVWLPGSSIRGVLADWCHREAPVLGVDRASVRRLFGVTPHRRDGSSKNDRQGRLTVLDVEIEEWTEQIRDHVRIDRRWGAAARGGKFDHEVAHPRTGTLRLIYEGDSQEDPELVLLQSAADALQQGLLAFGGKTGWGLGAARVGTKNGSGGLAWSLVDRKKTEGLSAYLGERLQAASAGRTAGDAAPNVAANAGPQRVPRVVEEATNRTSRRRESGEPPPWSWLRLRLRLAFDGPMLVAALDATVPPDDATPADLGDENAETDKLRIEKERRMADATYQVDSKGKPVLAGSALRGPLRSEAERIEETLDLEVDGIAETLFGTEDAQGLIRVEEGRLPEDEEAHHVLLNHVSIDRVTGFAADGRLFNAAALSSPCFDSELLVRWHADEEKHRQALALLFFVLRDAEQQGLWIGSRTTRGYGHAKQVKIKEARWSLVHLPNGSPPADDAGPTRREEASERSIEVAELANRLGFVQQAWNDAWPKTRNDVSLPSVAEGAGSGTAD